MTRSFPLSFTQSDPTLLSTTHRSGIFTKELPPRRREPTTFKPLCLMHTAHPACHKDRATAAFWMPLALLAAFFLYPCLQLRAEFDQTHPGLAKVLASFVKDGWVDYRALKDSPANLTEYLDEIAIVGREEFETWSEPERLAFLINTYNATTLQLIIDHYPVKGIRSIGGLFSSPWRLKVVHMWGESFTLDDLEHELIRRRFVEPRIHYALVCAARSCPPLRHEPYIGRRLNDQLQDQGRIFLSTPEKNRVDPKAQILWLSPIFKWFESDFTRGKISLKQYILPQLKPEDQPLVASNAFRIKYTDYDWSLNDRPSQAPKISPAN